MSEISVQSHIEVGLIGPLGPLLCIKERHDLGEGVIGIAPVLGDESHHGGVENATRRLRHKGVRTIANDTLSIFHTDRGYDGRSKSFIDNRF